MKLLIAVLLSIIIIISSTPIDEFNQHRQQALDANGTLAYNQDDSLNFVNSMDGLVESNFSLPSSSFRLLRRRRRQIDEAVTTAVEQMQMISRLTNAIYLQKALINGTVDAETLISELLHFGSVTPAQIQTIDSGEVEKALNSLQALPSKLETGDKLDAVEKCFNSVKTVLEKVEGIQSVESWPEETAFSRDIDGLISGTLGNFTVFNNFKTTLVDWVSIQGKAETSKTKTTWEQTDANRLIELAQASKEMLDLGESLSQEIPKIFEFSNTKTAANAVRFLDKLVKGVRQVETEKFVVPTEGFETLQKNIDQISKVLKEVSKVQPSIEHVKTIFLSRTMLKSVSTYTLGFPRGYEDVTRIFSHFNNPWFAETVKDKRLGESFKSLKSLEAINNVDKLLERNGGSELKLNAILDLVDVAVNLKKTFLTHSLGDTSGITKCLKVPSVGIADDDVKKLIDAADKIDVELEGLHKYLVQLKGSLTNPDFVGNLKKLIEICEKVNLMDSETYKTSFEQFANFANWENTKKYIDALSIAHEGKHSAKLIQHSQATKDLLPAVATYLSNNKKFIEVLSCLIKNPATLPTITIITDSRNLRNQKSAHEGKVSKALDVVKVVDATRKELKVLDTSIKGIKNFKSNESDLLYAFKDSESTYKTIGPAVRGIESMKLAIKEKSKIDVITSESATVEAELRNAKKPLSNEDTTRLNELVTLGTSLNTMYQQLNTWGADVKSLSFKNLSDYSNVFVKAKGVTGLNVDLGAISESLEKLIKIADPSSQGKLREVNDALNYLNGMGMQFASYSKTFDGTEKSLTDLDLFLSSFASLISVTPPPPLNSQNAGSDGKPLTGKKEENKMSTGEITAIVIGALLLVAGLIAGLIIWLCCSKKKEDDDDNTQLLVETFRKSDKPFVPIQIDKDHASRFFREWMSEIIRCGNTKKLDKRSWGIEPDALFNPKHPNYITTKQDFDYIFYIYLLDWCRSIHSNVNNDLKGNDISPFVKKHVKECRESIELVKGTRVVIPLDYKFCKFETDFLHANFVQQKNSFLMVLTQGPQIATKNESAPNKNTKKDTKLPENEKLSTMEKFWYMVYINKFEAILMLCQLIEGGVQQCDEYFPPTKGAVKQFGPFKIKCTAIINDPDFVQRTLTVSVEGESTTHTLTHFQYLSWPNQSVPKEIAKLIRIWKLVRNSPQGAVIHCSDGAGRTGTMAYIEELYQAACNAQDGKIAHQLLLGKLREKRASGVQNKLQLAYAYYCAIVLLFDGLTDVSAEDTLFLESMHKAWKKLRPKTEQEEAEFKALKKAELRAIKIRNGEKISEKSNKKK